MNSYYKLKSLAGVILLSLIISCDQKDDVVQKVKTPDLATVTSDTHFVTLDEARQLAPNIGKLIYRGKGLSSGRTNSIQRVMESQTVLAGDIPYYYVINYEGGGWALISSDRRTNPILAFGTEGAFTSMANSGSILWEQSTVEMINQIRTSDASVENDAIASEWTTLECLPDPVRVAAGKTADDCHPYDEFVSQQTVGPLLTTTWDQGCGYNANCPVMGGPCGHALTGCVATAMAQVIRYWRYPSGYDYNSMSNYSGNSSVAVLMAAAGNSVNMNYGAGESGASAGDIDDALKGAFHYTSATFTDYGSSTYMTVQNNLNYNRPAILAGCTIQHAILGIPYDYSDCHAWVCDGYQQTNYVGYSILHFHMNWGWSHVNDGFYQFNNWYIQDGNINYQYNLRAVVNIYP